MFSRCLDPSKNSPSFLKLIEDDDPVFLEIPNDFASMMSGEQPPYNESVKIVEGNNIWFVRMKRIALGPVLGDDFTKAVRDSGITKNDYLLFQCFGPSSFFVSVFKSSVHENCFISKIKPEDDVMADEFRRQFYGQNFKGGESTLYVGDRFWNVKMDGLSDSCVFTHGCSEMVNDLALDRRSTFVFATAGYKTFEVSVFNHQTGTETQFKKVDLVVLDNSIYGDDGYDVVIADIDDSKFDKFFSSLIEMEDVKKKKTDPKGKTKVVGDENQTSKVKTKFEMDLDNFLIPKNKSHVDPKGITYVGDGNQTSKVCLQLVKSKFEMDLDNFFIPKNKSHADPRGKPIVFYSDRSLSSIVVSDVSISDRIWFSRMILNYVFIYLFRPCQNVKVMLVNLWYQKKQEGSVYYINFLLFIYLLDRQLIIISLNLLGHA
ncbi:putative transcription factor B3-Domain family [Helianthus anomalus]